MARYPLLSVRTALAVALSVVGIAGFSVASASQQIDVGSGHISVGQGTFIAACDQTVSVWYSYDASAGSYTDLVVSDVHQECQGKSLQYTVRDQATGELLATGSIPVTAAQVSADLSSVPLTAAIGSVDIIIS